MSEVIPFLNQHTYIYRVQMDRRTFLEYSVRWRSACSHGFTGGEQYVGINLTLLPGGETSGSRIEERYPS
jgi:hypothetical protein